MAVPCGRRALSATERRACTTPPAWPSLVGGEPSRRPNGAHAQRPPTWPSLVGGEPSRRPNGARAERPLRGHPLWEASPLGDRTAENFRPETGLPQRPLLKLRQSDQLPSLGAQGSIVGVARSAAMRVDVKEHGWRPRRTVWSKSAASSAAQRLQCPGDHESPGVRWRMTAFGCFMVGDGPWP